MSKDTVTAANVPAQDAPVVEEAVEETVAKTPTVAARSAVLLIKSATDLEGKSPAELSAMLARCNREINWAKGQAAKETWTRKDHIGRKDEAVKASLARRTAAYEAVKVLVLAEQDAQSVKDALAQPTTDAPATDGTDTADAPAA